MLRLACGGVEQQQGDVDEAFRVIEAEARKIRGD